MVEQHSPTNTGVNSGQLETSDDTRVLVEEMMTAPSITRASVEIEEEDIQGASNQEMKLEMNNDYIKKATCMSSDKVMSRDDMRVMMSMNDDNCRGEKDEDRISQGCVHKRGKCAVHKLKRNKMIVKHKRFGKIKTGYGWIHSQTVRYTCPMDSYPDGHKFS